MAWAAACAAQGAEPAPRVAEADWGPLASWIDDSDGNARFRAVGPFWERSAGTNGMHLRAYPRPLWARAADPAAERTAWDFVWPLAAGKTLGEQKSWRVLLAFFFDRDQTDPKSQVRFWALPFWFHGRDEQGAGYAALWPLGGEIRNFFWQDRIRFVLWPLWARSQIHEARTTDVLWPVYSRTATPDGHLEKFRVFPLYARAVSRRQYEKHAVLWPVWTHARYVHPKAQGAAWVLFPLVGRVNLNSQKGWMVFPPLIQFVRGEQLTRTFCPWPFFQRETGVRDKLYVWPLFGRRREAGRDRTFWAWPVVSRDRSDRGRHVVTRWSVAPLWTSVSLADNPNPPPPRRGAPLPAGKPAKPTRVTANRAKLWPLVSRSYDLERGAYRLRLLDLWPAGHPPPVERSWAPLWTLVDYRVRGADGDLDVLWGLGRATRRAGGARAFSLFPLWRHERAAGDAARRWSVLKGLIAYDRTATSRQVRLLWLGRIGPAAPGKAAAAP